MAIIRLAIASIGPIREKNGMFLDQPFSRQQIFGLIQNFVPRQQTIRLIWQRTLSNPLVEGVAELIQRVVNPSNVASYFGRLTISVRSFTARVV